MGQRYAAICRECTYRFEVSEGGGSSFHLLHCTKCGQEKAIGFDALGDIHAAYLKGLPGPYATATREHDAAVRQGFQGAPISRQKYHAQVDAFAGHCPCGGRYTLRASARCPQCKSKSFAQDPTGAFICYDGSKESSMRK